MRSRWLSQHCAKWFIVVGSPARLRQLPESKALLPPVDQRIIVQIAKPRAVFVIGPEQDSDRIGGSVPLGEDLRLLVKAVVAMVCNQRSVTRARSTLE